MTHPIASTNRRLKRWAIAIGLLAVASLLNHWLWLKTISHPHFIHGWVFFCAGLLALVLVSAIWRLSRGAWKNGFRWIVGRDALRIAGWSAVLAISVLAMFYSVELWTGKRALVAVHREAAARGEAIGLDSMQPPPIPDQQNFARALFLAPLWNVETNGGGQVRTRQTEAADELMRIATSHTNLLRGGVRHYPLATLWMYGQRAECPKAETQSGRAELAEELLSYSSQVSQIKEATQRPFCMFPGQISAWQEHRDPRRGTVVLSQLVRLMRARAIAELNLGRSEDALSDAITALRLTRYLWQQPGPMQWHPNGQSTLLALQPIWEGLSSRSWNTTQLAELQEHLAVDLLSNYPTVVRTDTAAMSDLCEMIVRPAPGKADTFMAEAGSGGWALSLFRLVYPRGWLYRDQAALYRFSWKQTVPAIDIAGRKMAGISPKGRQLLTSSSDPFFPVFIVPKMLELAACAPQEFTVVQTAMDLASVACALERYRLAEGNYPDALEKLVPRFVSMLPHDVIDGKPLRYRVLPDGTFILYSIGGNRVDEGGTSPVQREHGPDPLGDNDWVWRYTTSPNRLAVLPQQ